MTESSVGGGQMVEAVDILICEPDPREARKIQTEMRAILNEVTVIADRDEARRALLREGEWADAPVPGLIILTAEMIGTHLRECWELVQHATSTPPLDRSEWVILSSRPSTPDLDRAAHAGATWYGGRPVQPEALRDILRDIEEMGMAVVRMPEEGEDG